MCRSPFPRTARLWPVPSLLLACGALAWTVPSAPAAAERVIRLDSNPSDGEGRRDVESRILLGGPAEDGSNGPGPLRPLVPSDEEDAVPADGEEGAWVLPETDELRRHQARLEEAGIGVGKAVGGTAMIGLRLAGRQHRLNPEALPPAVIDSHGAWDGYGAFIVEVVPGTPADFADLQAGDVIVQYGGIWVDTHELLVTLASRSRLDHEQELWVLRDGVVVKTWLRPRERDELDLPEPQ